MSQDQTGRHEQGDATNEAEKPKMTDAEFFAAVNSLSLEGIEEKIAETEAAMEAMKAYIKIIRDMAATRSN